MKLFETFGNPVPDGSFLEPVFLAGLECEIEGVANPGTTGIFKVDKDGSLRGHGYEFISSPATRQELVEEFKNLHSVLKFYPDEDPFSHRTSTHVHVNCLALEASAVRNIILLYALFEEFFFSMVKQERRDNIHCVPLSETHLANHYRKNLEGMVQRWHKYTALNLIRLQDLGTIEFRHLHGTGDAEELDVWLRVLENLWTLGQRIEITQATLGDQYTIIRWFEQIFSPAESVMKLRPMLFDVIKNGLIDVKFSTI